MTIKRDFLMRQLLAALCWLPVFTFAQPQYEMTTYHLTLLHAGPAWSENTTPETTQHFNAHLAHLRALRERSVLVIAGPIQGEGSLRGIAVLSADSLLHAKALMETSPMVAEGWLRVEALNWWAAKGIMKASSHEEMSEYYWGFLVKGDTWRPVRTPETDSLQVNHLAHITRTAESGKLVIAGPVGGSETIRGILVYKTESIEEARAFAEADPAVQAGRLAVQLFAWHVPKGSLP
jgi:uncharacterized protein YciI